MNKFLVAALVSVFAVSASANEPVKSPVPEAVKAEAATPAAGQPSKDAKPSEAPAQPAK